MKFANACTLATCLVATTLVPLSGSAQQRGSVLGHVIDDVDGLPLGKVVATIAGTKLRAVTDSLGEFRIDGVEPGEVLVRLERSGYVKISESVLVHDGWTTSATFELAPVAVLLDALRAYAGSRPSGVESAPRRSVRPESQATGNTTDRLGVQVPGVHVMRPSGEVGRGARVLIRGPSSISLSNQPVVYLDGVRVQASMTGFRNEGLFSLDFISPDAIDRIEVLKGPSAAAVYGPGSANGVILIYSKR